MKITKKKKQKYILGNKIRKQKQNKISIESLSFVYVYF